jgi:large subunit ribosomal protein L25
MADEIRLDAQPRTVTGKQVKQLRRSGIVPIVLYGGHISSSPLQAAERPLRSVLARAGHNRLIYLNLGDPAPRVVLAREIQREPMTGRLLHVDLQEVSLTEKMTLDVPIALRGIAPPVARGEGLMIHGLEAVSIRVLPTHLIPEIVVDVSVLNNVNDALHVSDLRVDDMIEILTASDEMIAKIIPVKEEVIVEEVPVAAAEVEVIGKGKKEEEEAAPAEGAPKAAEPKKEEKK